MNEMRDLLHEQQADAVRASRNAGFLNAPLLSWFVAMLVGGFFMGWIGALGSYQYPFALRLSLWLGLCTVAGMLALSIETILSKLTIQKRGIIVTGLCLTAALAAAMTPIVYLLNSVGEAQPLATIPQYLGNSIVISGLLVAGRLMLGISLRKSVTSDSASSSDDSPPIIRRLKPSLRHSVLHALKSEGHYVRVYTEDGDDLVLMRLRDAIAEVGATDGMQVHRSWWIARSSVESSERKNDATVVTLRNGAEVTVSRSFRSDWREAAWV